MKNTKNTPKSQKPPKSQEKNSEIETLKTQISVLQKELLVANETRIRSLADLENFRRREEENKKNWGNIAIADFLKNFLPSFLELHLGMVHSKDENIKKVVIKFFEALKGSGLEKIEPVVGENLNPEFHEVLVLGEGEPGTVVQVFEPGWKLKGNVLLPAKVSAAQS